MSQPCKDEQQNVADKALSGTAADMDGNAQDQQFYGPPAHIAARFYRTKLNVRRKSSAASSRRNSLSSAHSHASSHRHAAARATQNHYIAQHLRRASILEDRKARLADRAAHAEQVRLRAALAKAAPRGNLSNSEERALAAQVAKEKYLAKVAAACAEEVARAKRIAEEVKERKLAEEARVRSEMEERHAEAERRRAEYQRNLHARRARRADSAEKKLAVVEESLDADEESILEEKPANKKPLSHASAAKRLQRAWRLHRRRLPVLAFNEAGLTGEHAQSSTFEDLTALVAEPDIISCTTSILTHLGLQDADDANAPLNTRTFLSAYLILGHPVAVLTNKSGTQEQDLIVKAADLISKFEVSVARLARWNNYSINALQLEDLSQSYTAYTSAFAAWRLQDSSVLIEGMVASFVELDAIWQTVKDDSRGEVASDYREGIRDNQVMLLSRIRRLAGPDRADFLIKKAIRESRRRRPKKRTTAEVRPRGLEVSNTVVSSSAGQAIEDNGIPAIPSDSGDLSKLFLPVPSNREMTHELAIDKEYRLEDRNSKVREFIYLSMCESMRRGFESGDGSVWTVSAAQAVREKLLRMLKPGNTMHTLISETLDLDDIDRQCRRGVFSYAGFFDFMATILPKLCAPFRDQEVRALADELVNHDSGEELSVMLSKLVNLLRVVDLMCLDYTNFMIMNAAPVLIKEAPGYEHRQFAAALESGNVSLDQTKQWWRNGYALFNAEAIRREQDGVRITSESPVSYKVYTNALVDTVFSREGLDPDNLPETLKLDQRRLHQIRASTIRIAVVGAILLTTKNLLKRDVRSQWKNEAIRLWVLLSSDDYENEEGDETEDSASSTVAPVPRLTSVHKAFTILESAHNMPPSTKQSVASMIARFFAQAADAMEPDIRSTAGFTDPTLKVLYQRLRSHISSHLLAETSADRVRAASSASEKLAACGMAEFTSHVADIVTTLDRVRRVDWEGHSTWHHQIVQEIEGQQAGSVPA